MTTTPDAASQGQGAISALLQEDRRYPPSDEFRANANLNDPAIYEKAKADPEAFWARFANELECQRPFTGVLDWDPPNARWFADGQLNACVNCVDRHIRGAAGMLRAVQRY